MKKNHIAIITIFLFANLLLGVNLMAMDDEPAAAALDYTQEKQIHAAKTADELMHIIGDNTNLVLLKKALLILVETVWNSTSALKINHLLKQISILDQDRSLVRFDDTQDDIMGCLLQNHKPASIVDQNTDLPDWIAWFAQRGVAVDALSNGSASEEGYTPLVWAVFYERIDVVQKLLQLGAQISTVNRPKNEKPFTVLERYGDSKDPSIIAIVRLLKNYHHSTELPAQDPDWHRDLRLLSDITPAQSQTPPEKDPVATTVVVPTQQPQPHIPNTTATTMLRPQGLLIAGGIMLALYAGYRWLSKQSAEKDVDNTDEGYDTPAN